ncbi:hypothetical protein KM043_003619 [Ampulex compressa]|nr:hypothetical protein KM043_003619 [Ampulex compressa]
MPTIPVGGLRIEWRVFAEVPLPTAAALPRWPSGRWVVARAIFLQVASRLSREEVVPGATDRRSSRLPRKRRGPAKNPAIAGSIDPPWAPGSGGGGGGGPEGPAVFSIDDVGNGSLSHRP